MTPYRSAGSIKCSWRALLIYWVWLGRFRMRYVNFRMFPSTRISKTASGDYIPAASVDGLRHYSYQACLVLVIQSLTLVMEMDLSNTEFRFDLTILATAL